MRISLKSKVNISEEKNDEIKSVLKYVNFMILKLFFSEESRVERKIILCLLTMNEQNSNERIILPSFVSDDRAILS